MENKPEIWKPNPGPQTFVLTIPTDVFEILYGGARGGGKTDAGFTWLLRDEYEKGKLYIDHPRYRALILRKSADDLSDWLDRASYHYKRYGAKIAGRPAIINFPSGAKFRTGHLKDKRSYDKYLGHEYQSILVEELTQIALLDHYIRILGSCRSTITGLKPQIFCTTNPGNSGHVWVYDRFVEPYWSKRISYGTAFRKSNERPRIYVPAKIEDNPILMEKDPGYVQYIDSIKKTDPDLYRAWRLGDWSVFAGQFFRDFRPDIHTAKFGTPSEKFPRYGGSDWGYSPRPFVFLASAMEKVPWKGSYFNRLWVYREIRGTKKNPDVWAKRIKETEDVEKFEWMMADPSMDIKQPDGSMSILDQFGEEGIDMIPANNDRVNGWQAVRKWLSIAPDGLPYMIISRNCRYLIKNLPTLAYDENRNNDLDTDGLDDEADALRYKCIHLKWIDAFKLIPRGEPEKKGLPAETGKIGDMLEDFEEATDEGTRDII